MKEELLLPGERLDDLQRNGYMIIQNPAKFCFGIDAVLLSDFAKVNPGEKMIDLGTGNGIIPILVESRSKGERYVGLEIQPESADIARRSVEYNNLEDKISIETGDIKDAAKIFGASSFDVVTSNPPYMIQNHGLTNEADAKTIARHEILCDLEDVVRQTSCLLRQKGHCYYVHRPNRLVDLMSLMRKYKIEPKRMRFVYPYVDKEPNMVLIEGIKGGKPNVIVEKPLIVYDDIGVYNPEIYDIYGYDDKTKAKLNVGKNQELAQ
ncbi:MAG: tRNA1(Val) (adenine(37)-N6)-methyltransferase [Lachnospiraceae bacterium]|nr:tRNA1(Val) (adenine(37)-N6)-methyltransferase [Lachnospiraceae bacterium]